MDYVLLIKKETSNGITLDWELFTKKEDAITRLRELNENIRKYSNEWHYGIILRVEVTYENK